MGVATPPRLRPAAHSRSALPNLRRWRWLRNLSGKPDGAGSSKRTKMRGGRSTQAQAWPGFDARFEQADEEWVLVDVKSGGLPEPTVAEDARARKIAMPTEKAIERALASDAPIAAADAPMRGPPPSGLQQAAADAL